MQRPRLHFTHDRHWINDPNGLIRVPGGYRLFYQYAADSPDYKRIRWNSARSRDLLAWDVDDGVLSAAGEQQGASAYSGSVIRAPDASLLAFYTEHRPQRHDAPQMQTIGVAQSRNHGAHFTVLTVDLFGHGARNFRDPFVCAIPGGGYLMLVAEPCDWLHWSGEPGSTLAVFKSDDLMHWERSGTIGPWQEPGLLWEVPWLHFLGGGGATLRCLLGISTVDRRQDTAHGNSRCWLGHFDGQTFQRAADEPAAGRLLDFGPDYYAATVAQTGAANRPPSDVDLLAWHGSWDTARQLPFDGFRGGPLSWLWTLRFDSALRWMLPDKPVLSRTPVASLELTCSAETTVSAHSGLRLKPGVPFAADVRIDLGGASHAVVEFAHAHCSFGLVDRGARFTLRRATGPTTAAVAGFAGEWTQQRGMAADSAAFTVWFDGCVVDSLWDAGAAKASAIVDVDPQVGAISLHSDGAARARLDIRMLTA